MSEVIPTPPAPTPGSDPGAGSAGEVTVPEGYVPAAAVEEAREEARRRYQSEKDRLEAEVTRLKAAPAPAAPAGQPKDDSGFDLDAIRRQAFETTLGAVSLATSLPTIRAEFPHADEAIFTPERLSQFASADALRIAAEDSHKRVTAILDREREAMEARLREELAAGSAGGQGPVGGTPPASGGDPTPEQLASMPFAEYAKLSDEVIDRVMAKAQA